MARLKYAEQLMADATLELQAQALADCVLETFSDAVTTPPPA